MFRATSHSPHHTGSAVTDRKQRAQCYKSKGRGTFRQQTGGGEQLFLLPCVCLPLLPLYCDTVTFENQYSLPIYILFFVKWWEQVVCTFILCCFMFIIVQRLSIPLGKRPTGPVEELIFCSQQRTIPHTPLVPPLHQKHQPVSQSHRLGISQRTSIITISVIYFITQRWKAGFSQPGLSMNYHWWLKEGSWWRELHLDEITDHPSQIRSSLPHTIHAFISLMLCSYIEAG